MTAVNRLSPNSDDPAWSNDFFSVEYDDVAAFRWSSTEFSLQAPAGSRYVEIEAGRPDAGAQLVAAGTVGRVACELRQGWQRISILLSGGEPATVAFRVEPPVRAAGETRRLGLMIRSIVWHDDEERHRHCEAVHTNSILSEEEFVAGAVVVRSVPPHLRICVEVRCNIANREPCVYCPWEWSKRAEEGAPRLDVDFLRGLGKFLYAANEVVDCGVGEPPLNPHFADIVDLVTDADRLFLLTSNGQTLGARVRKALLGRKVDLCVSLDSADAAGYARYRDHRFDLIIENLRKLCQERRLYSGWPRVALSFSDRSQARCQN